MYSFYIDYFTLFLWNNSDKLNKYIFNQKKEFHSRISYIEFHPSNGESNKGQLKMGEEKIINISKLMPKKQYNYYSFPMIL